MDVWQALLLGVVQGITEFLPISSSGHLILAEELFGLQVEYLLSFDVMLHAGTLVALVVYFWKDLVQMASGFFLSLRRDGRGGEAGTQAWLLIIATLPVVILGPFMKDYAEGAFRSPTSVVLQLGATAIFLAIAELFGKHVEGKVHSAKTALLMGFFQVIAIIPGISRSGATIIGGLFGGLTREAAARFSFLMAIPAIAGAVVFFFKDYQVLLESMVSVPVLITGFLSSMVVSFLAISWLLNFLKTRSMWWFVGYLLLLNGAWFLAA